jgi:NADH-ubiquinone oxidoreductase chain 6
MNSTLYLIYETFTNGYIPNVLDIISILAILSAIFVILNKNPIISVLCLIGLFASISCYLIIIGLSFIGLSYLIVYIGAVSRIFLFILMLINIIISEYQNILTLVKLIGLVLLGSIFFILIIYISFESVSSYLLDFINLNGINTHLLSGHGSLNGPVFSAGSNANGVSNNVTRICPIHGHLNSANTV